MINRSSDDVAWTRDVERGDPEDGFFFKTVTINQTSRAVL